ncbi:hypothetical protein JJE66_08725 [Bradyrhizobium diazoefficiens]|uniref:hypothetical protein n=1 Tax=Bradyrhizobium diazoefficiens TaxID=1355477 RepID=UPI00190BBD44|nr:hypothetical protein [Bradyrhizobium diazoefficiens]MBK3661333.1 hypothetical protein [Bradyrhizobium diazoefficiens]
MSNEDYEWEAYIDDEVESRPRDSKVDQVKEVLLKEFLGKDAGEVVYYGRQLEVALERSYFHWITKRGLNELKAEGAVAFSQKKLDDVTAHFYRPRRHRYPNRQMNESMGLIREFSASDFTRALGHNGEQLADAGFARAGFRILSDNLREVSGKKWTETRHNLDRLVERDGIQYGVEIKNQLGYIDQSEFEIKLRMMQFFGVRPMFIVRMMPKNYINDVYRAGGFCLLLGDQHYPLLASDLAKRVREKLGLPVNVVRALPDTALKRFEDFHLKLVKGGKQA